MCLLEHRHGRVGGQITAEEIAASREATRKVREGETLKARSERLQREWGAPSRKLELYYYVQAKKDAEKRARRMREMEEEERREMELYADED